MCAHPLRRGRPGRLACFPFIRDILIAGPTTIDLSGRRFGHIRVSEPLGEGGMGAVYAGFDETLRRRVAVKVVQAHYRRDPEARARLIREARSLSQLDHPNICRIHDYIEGDDADLLVLEYIDGKTLRQTIDENRPLRAEALRIATALAEVLVLAHRAGIVHRDLKPENVMLTPEGQVKVLDFGLARWLEDRGITAKHRALSELKPDDAERTHTVRMYTEAGVAMGTPAYMSPEQARGEVLHPASDMYSFGLLLQTLFTGREPYAVDLSVRETILQAARGVTLPVTGVDRDVARLINDLKSFAPTDRPTAAEALKRLRHIAGKPKRLAQRIAAALLIAVFIAGIAKYMFDQRRERAAARAAEARAVAAQKEAATRRGQAEDLITFMLGDLRKKLEPLGKLELLDDVGERALKYSASLHPESMSGAELARISTALGQLGEVRIAQGRLDDATQIVARARELAAAAVKKEPDSEQAQYALARAYFYQGYTARLRADPDTALRFYSLQLDTARRLAAAFPRNDSYAKEQAEAHGNIASLLMRRSRYDEARTHLELALRIHRAQVARDPLNLESQAGLALMLGKLGGNLARSGDLHGARAQYQEQKQINQALLKVAPGHARWKEQLALSHSSLCGILLRTGELADAEPECGEDLSIARSLAATDEQNTQWQYDLGLSLIRVAGLQGWRGNMAEADARMREAERLLEAIALRDPKRGDYRTSLGYARTRRALLFLEQRKMTAARMEWQRAWPLFRDSGADQHTAWIRADALITGIAVARANADPATVRDLSSAAEKLLAGRPRTSDPDSLAMHARLLLLTDRRNEAQPLITRLAAIGYHHPDYEQALKIR